MLTEILEGINTFKVEKIFLLFAIIFGFLSIFVTPAFQVPDEYAHFSRSYQVSELNISHSPDDIPTAVSDVINLNRNIPFNKNVKVNIQEVINAKKIAIVDNAREKSFLTIDVFVPYFPQAVGIKISRLFSNSPLVHMYWGRVLNLLMYILVSYYALKIIPVFKLVVFALLLMPMSLFQAASLSYDATLFCFSFLFFALFIKCLYENSIDNFSFIGLIISMLVLNTCKSGYFFITFIIFLFAYSISNNTKKKLCLIIFAVILPIFLFLVTRLLMDVNSESVTSKILSDENAIKQIEFILKNPIQYSIILIKTLATRHFYIDGVIGKLGWLDIKLPLLAYVYYSVFLLLLSQIDLKGFIFDIKIKIFCACLFIFMIVYVSTSMYVGWTACVLKLVGYERIKGIQGRYFIPFLMLFFIFIGNNNQLLISRFNNKYLKPFIYASVFNIGVVMIYSIFKRYYCSIDDLIKFISA